MTQYVSEVRKLEVAYPGGVSGIDANTVSLLHFDGAGGSTTITDEIAGRSWDVVSAAQLDTAQKKYGASSLVLDGAEACIWHTDNTIFRMVSGVPITVECWIHPNVLPPDNYPTGDWAQNVFCLAWYMHGQSWHLYVARRTDLYYLDLWTYNGIAMGLRISGAISISTGNWYHIALVKGVDNNGYLFFDGNQVGSTTPLTVVVQYTVRFHIGGYSYNKYHFNGWIDEFRCSDIARWTSSFTPHEYYSSQFLSEPRMLEVAYPSGTQYVSEPRELEIAYIG